ncbi:MAG: radical SAM protein [Alphaproteobacteria bacterium]|nr:radical SAM protein [Alphaproteobacteria bacterium]
MPSVRADLLAHLRHALDDGQATPATVRLRMGRGVHLLFEGEPGPLTVVLAPGDDPQACYTRTDHTSVRYVGDDDLGPARRAWVETTVAAVRAFETRPGWVELLQAGAEARGISVDGVRTDVQRTSGSQLLVRLLEPCNARCDFCACVGVMDDLTRDRSEVEATLRRGFDVGYRDVAFTGGEPTLLPDLARHVAAAKAIGFTSVTVQTNAVNLDDAAYVQGLADAGLDTVLVSLHGHTAALHDAVLKLPGAFDRIQVALRHLVEAGVRVQLNHVLHTVNLPHLDAFIRYVHALQRELVVHGSQSHLGLTLSFVSPIGETLSHDEIVPPIADAAPALARALAVAEALGSDVHVPGLCGLPLCTMPGWETFLDEYRGGDVPALPTRRYVAACDGCGWRSRCSGYWSHALDLHGDDQLGPGPRPWGRDPEPALAPQLALVLRKLKAKGLSEGQIADTLARRGIQHPRGRRWWARDVVLALHEA